MQRKNEAKDAGLIYVVVGILKQGDKLLLAERPSDKPYAGYWEFPGGKVEEYENVQLALKRELYEELGIEVISSKHLFDHHHTYPDKRVLLEVWSVTQFLGQPRGKENQSLRWVTFTEMRELNLLEGNWVILDRLLHEIV